MELTHVSPWRSILRKKMFVGIKFFLFLYEKQSGPANRPTIGSNKFFVITPQKFGLKDNNL